MLEKLLPLGRLLILLVTTTVIVLSFCAAPLTEAAGGQTCVTARVGHSFRLPDGELRPAGRLTVCRLRTYSPVAELHLISVDRRPLGMFLSRSRVAEVRTPPLAPEIVFRRDHQGNLELMGYSIASRGRRIAHRLTALSSGGTWDADDARQGIPIVAAIAR
jgi:hypothetical protein